MRCPPLVCFALAATILLPFGFAGCELQAGGRSVERAVAVMRPVGDSGVEGVVTFVAEGDAVRVVGTLRGLSPGEHGFHVHEYGDLRDQQDGKSAGGHYAPEDSPHGRPSDEQRHVGDLGNIEANEEGVAKIDMTDPVIALNGPHSILGRALVVHADPDEFTGESGDAGARVGFGVIGIAGPGQ